MLLGNINRNSIFLALVYLCASGQGARIVIGYRVVAEAEARIINDRNAPFRDPARDSEFGSQIGNGVYLGKAITRASLPAVTHGWMTTDQHMSAVDKPGGWRETRGRTNYHCVFKADEDRFDDAAKAWVPSDYWDKGEASIARYIRGFDEHPDETVRISYIAGYGEALQMLLPTRMVNADTLDFYARCFPSRAELMAYENESVDWTDWNLYGEPGEPEW
ncbi:hypothetical protein CH063_10748 [Colletotrichum higginsianum]|uniref:Uncharacterized protein n=1 Tax=Colletotrichum higginsianum (strain IMI 349063) TaxID=759273 RepID=H1VIN0_COLHI|nr:hypothetical protein CH63R_03944 [Colletotrichum higginsianum IMI 349063]OBR11648.1 hypothetical protein CH63R_03944 [Colletotrichum higginsianum IMI 349063]CCF40083.1 hypothetical protein CH063_10748 [Colletotrichum higginsianum]